MTDEKREVNVSDEPTVDDITQEDLDALDNDETTEGEEATTEETQEESEEEEATEETPSESSPEIKEVSGETPRERALRLEVTRLKRERRENQQKAMFPENKEEKPDMSDLESLGYSGDELEGISKLFDAMADKKGYVKKDQSYKEMAQDTLGSFIEEHTEYAPENDTEDIRWSRFNTILKEDYNIQGKTQKQLQSIFNKIDRDVKEELGETVTPNKANKTQAQRQKIGSVSAGTSSSSKDVVRPVKIQSASGNRKSIGGVDFKDFDDDDFDEV